MVKVDVVLPVYNGAKYLRSSIDSVLAQQNVDFTLYILDDFSNDNSWEIIKKYKDSRIVAARNEHNIGLFANLNNLLRLGSAELIKIWAQDDLMESNCLAEFARYYQTYNFDFAYADCTHINASGQALHYNILDNTPKVISADFYRDICIFNGSISSNISNAAISRRAITEYGYFREDYIASGDHEYWSRICLNAGAIRIPEKLLSIRVHPNQLSRSNKTAVAFAVEDYEITELLWKACGTANQINIAKEYYKKVILSYHFNTMLKLLTEREFAKSFRMASFISSKKNFYVAAIDFVRMKFMQKRMRWEAFRNNFIDEYNER